MTAATPENALSKGITFLASTQQADGGFVSFSSPSQTPFKQTLRCRTTFGPALILASLAGLNQPGAVQVRNKLATWLMNQRSPHWSFNYWAKAAPERQTLPYPDDLDDTFCALIALCRHDRALVDEAVLASAVKLLLAAETKVGGPYRTWLTRANAPKIWQDVDLAVNANIAGFLRLVAEPLPSITQLMEQAITDRTFRSPYYPSAYPVAYYIARAYDGPLKTALADYLIGQRQDGWWGNPLNTALAVSSLARLGRADECDQALVRLLASQQADGSWPAEAFCLDPAVQNKPHYSGSAALTTAFVLEALAACRPAVAQQPAQTAKPQHDPQDDQTAALLHRRVVATAEARLQNVGPTLRKQLQKALDQTWAKDASREVALLPYFFSQSLQSLTPPSSALPPNLLVQLGTANVYGWTAYTIYDDFLDGEGDPAALSAANAALRYSVDHFRQALPHDTQFQAHTAQVFDTVDDANAWELAHCRMVADNTTITIDRLPNYVDTLNLANRSLGHTLTPLAVLAASGIPPDEPRARQVSLALRHYIAARQLSDDLHDWEADLRAGIITCVVARLLQDLHIPPGTHSLGTLMPKLQRHFWHHTLPAMCDSINRHTTLARNAARQSKLLTQPNIITRLTNKIDSSTQNTLTEQTKAQAFLAAYKGTTTPRARTQSSPKPPKATSPTD